MKNQKMDRRSLRTRQSLRDALVDLLLEKPYSDVTVGHILERANVGRSTFYAHYLDKDDLLISEMAAVIESFEQHIREAGEPAEKPLPSLSLFHHVKSEQRLIRAFLWGRGTEIVLRDFQAHLASIIEQKLSVASSDRQPQPIPAAAAARVIAGVFITLLNWWFEEDLAQTPEAMDIMFQSMVMPSFKELLYSKREHE